MWLEGLFGEPGKRSHQAVGLHRQGEGATADLRSEGQRHPDSLSVACAREGGRRRADHRQGELGGDDLTHQKFSGHRLHVRAIVRDGRDAFIGSQSLRSLELDKRREVGLFVKSGAIVKELLATFEADWGHTSSGRARKARQSEAATVAAAAP